MAAKLFVLVACIALSRATLVRRDAPAPAPLQDLEKHAMEFQKSFTEQFNQISSSKNTQDFNKAVREGSDTVLQQLSAFSDGLQSALGDANGKAKAALEQTRQSLERTEDELRQARPAVEQASALQTAVRNAVQETQKLAKEVARNVEATNEKLAPKIMKAYDDFVRQALQVQKNLQEAANQQ